MLPNQSFWGRDGFFDRLGGSAAKHLSNHAGGMEGGMTNGERLRFKIAKKPISTQKNPLQSVDMNTGEVVKSAYYRSDVTAVPALTVIAEAVTSFTIDECILETIGGPHIEDVKDNLKRWADRKPID